jgi:hypothetical protein
MRTNGAPRVLELFQAICNPNERLPLQTYKRPMPDHDRREISGDIVTNDSSPEMGRNDESFYNSNDDDDYERARKRKKSLLNNNDDDHLNNSDQFDNDQFGNDDFGGGDDFGNDDYGGGGAYEDVGGLHANELNVDDNTEKDKSYAQYDEPRMKCIQSMMRKLKRMSITSPPSSPSSPSPSPSSPSSPSTIGASINFNAVVSTKTVGSRENAALCFFELLTLASSGKVNVRQKKPYSNIVVILRSEEKKSNSEEA